MTNKYELIRTYRYEGSLALGSVVAHHCAAVGLFTDKGTTSDLYLYGIEENGNYTLRICHGEETIGEFSATADSDGRRGIGRDVSLFLRKYLDLPDSAWGTLVGVRPVKLYHKQRLVMGETGFRNYLTEDCRVSEEKADLLMKVGGYQTPYVERASQREDVVSLYGGIPFCTTRCTYCSFPYGLIQNYSSTATFVKSFIADIRHMKNCLQQHNLTVESLYLGGGTPTSLYEDDFKSVLAEFARLSTDGGEFTVEAGRPDTVTPAKLDMIQRSGASRISINPQTLQNHLLQTLNREHTVKDIKRLYKTVRERTNLDVNMDFIAGLPQQQYAHMVENMDYVCQWLPENVTIHTLALKKGSALYAQKDNIELPVAAEVEDMIALCHERLLAAGYVPYYLYRQQYMLGQLENIGYTLPGKESAYNIQMMEERQSILSVGPGSATKLMRAPDYRQMKMHWPKDVNVYNETLETLLAKRQGMLEKFYGE